MANATGAVSGAAKKGVAGTTVTAVKAAVISPAFAGAAVLVGIIAFEWWKGSRDARKFTTAKNCQSDVSK